MKFYFKKQIKLFLVFFIIFSLFLLVHLWSGEFISGDDSYYHAKHAYLIEQSGDLKLLKPWLEFHFLNYAPTDPWWGFHLGQALFIHWFGLFLGSVIFSSFLVALIFLVYYFVLNQLKITWVWFWVAGLFFTSVVFSYRLFLERPHLLSIIALPLALGLLIKGKNFWLFVLSLVYALSYHLAPLIILQTVIYLIVEAYNKKKLNLRPLIASTGGILAGIIIHPHSLNYVFVMFIHIWQVLFLKFTGTDLMVGTEIQPTSFSWFMDFNFLAIAIYLLSIVLFLGAKLPEENRLTRNFLFIYSGLWFLVILMVPRGVEYWLPVALLFAGLTLTDFTQVNEFKQIKTFFKKNINIKVLNFFIISIVLVFVSHNLAYMAFDFYYDRLGNDNADYYQANYWLKKNSPKESIVFYNSWSMWPKMFYFNDYNRYIAGMDPTFIYEYDPSAYWLWRNVGWFGLACDRETICLDLSIREQIKLVPLAIKSFFRADYVIIANDLSSNLARVLNNLRFDASLVFKNKSLLIYKIN